MRQRYLLYMILACMLLTVACTKDDDSTTITGGDKPIAFSAVMSSGNKGTTTRAQNDINANNDLSAEGGFGVFACYTGLHGYSDSNVSPDFMYNEHVTSADNGNTWSYSPVKYWPNGEGEVDGNTGSNKHYVSFLAYAPYSNDQSPDPANNPADYCIPTFSKQGEIGNPWLTYRLHSDVTKQVDLLYAQRLDETKPVNVNSKLQMQFNHALACVGDQITIKCSDNMKDNIAARLGPSVVKMKVVLNAVNITYTLTERGRLVLWNRGTEPNWQAIRSGNTTVTRSLSYSPVTEIHVNDNGVATDAPWTDSGHGVFYIPLDLSGNPQTVNISLSYEIHRYTNASDYVVERERTPEATLRLSDYENAFQGGKHLYINIDIDDVTLIVSAAITPWTDGGSTSAEAN